MLEKLKHVKNRPSLRLCVDPFEQKIEVAVVESEVELARQIGITSINSVVLACEFNSSRFEYFGSDNTVHDVAFKS